MRDDGSMMHNRTGWSGSRRTLLGAAALGMPILLPRGSAATPVAPLVPSGLRDFAYDCAALRLEAQERDDLKALAGLRLLAAALCLTPEALVAAQSYPEVDARRIFEAGATQLYAYVAANGDRSRALIVNLVDATTPEGAETILQTFRHLWPQNAVQLATAAEAPDADSAFLGADPSQTRSWLFGGVRFGNLVAVWQVGFRPETPDPALAVPINRLLHDDLTDQGASARRGASLAFLLTLPEQPTIGIGQTVLDGTALDPWAWDMDEAELARWQALATSAGIVNMLRGFFRGPGRLAPNLHITELASAEQARAYFASLQRDQPANDQQLGVTRRALASDEFQLTGWDDWQASAVRVQRDEYGALGVVVSALLDTFLMYVEAVDEVLPDTISAPSAPPGKDDPALRQWSAMAHQLLAPVPAAVRNASNPAARAIFPPPLPAFADPLAS